MTTGSVEAVSSNTVHWISKVPQKNVDLLAGVGVRGDAHAGETVQHVARVKRDPSQPNLRQVHLLHIELIEELATRGFQVTPGQMGENILTRGVDLLKLSTGSLIQFPSGAVLEVTGLRNPCRQLEEVHLGLLQAVLDRDSEGNVVRKSGIMCVVLTGGLVWPGDQFKVSLPPAPHNPLVPV
jgi:MOSC domain-containing protein YiiM